jgi:hypothetical protein
MSQHAYLHTDLCAVLCVDLQLYFHKRNMDDNFLAQLYPLPYMERIPQPQEVLKIGSLRLVLLQYPSVLDHIWTIFGLSTFVLRFVKVGKGATDAKYDTPRSMLLNRMYVGSSQQTSVICRDVASSMR